MIQAATTVIEKPILFSEDLVRAILDGRKTQTRRVLRQQPKNAVGICGYCPSGFAEYRGDACTCDEIPCPYFEGMRLWVRETWSHAVTKKGQACIAYRADRSARFALHRDSGEGDFAFLGESCEPWIEEEFKWSPSIHMKRAYSRIDLEITDVRAERLQDISEEDAIAEGAQCAGFPAALTNRGAFGKLWDSIYGNWNANPWVWAVTFKIVQ